MRQEVLVGLLLDLDEVRDVDDRGDLAEVPPRASPALNGPCHTPSAPWCGHRVLCPADIAAGLPLRKRSPGPTCPRARAGPPAPVRSRFRRLLDLDDGADLFELLLEVLRLVLADLLLHRLRRAVD